MADTNVITPAELRFERVLDAPLDTVWRWLVEPELRARWFMAGPTEAHVGGQFGMSFHHENLSDGDVATPERFAKNAGASWHETITRYDPPRVLAFSWDGGKAGEVTFTLAPEGDKTRLTLVHARLRGAEDARNFGGGWLSHLAVLEARLAGRPVPDFWAIHAEKEAEAAAAVSESDEP